LRDKNPLKVIKHLKKHNIEARFLWKPMHLQPLCKGAIVYENGMSEQLFRTGICLPSGTQLSKKDVKYICRIVNDI